MKKIVLVIGLSLVLALSATACGGQQASTTAAPEAAAETTAAAAETTAAETAAAETTAAETTAAPETTAAETAAETTAAETAAETAATAEITEDDAKNIALKEAGFDEADVTITKIEKDLDDGIWKYEVEFINGDQEYSYDIDLMTGEIMGFDVDSVLDD